MKLLSYSNLNDVYTSLPFPISLNADGVISKISWIDYVPEESQVIIQTRFSFDSVNWSEWRTCINGGQIPEINEDTATYGLQMMFRVLMSANKYDLNPYLSEISFSFEPVIVFDNRGDIPCEPEVWITKVNNGDFAIINLSHNSEEFKFTQLIDQEVVYVNNEQQDIETSLPVTYRYTNFNDNYLSFPIGKNVLRIEGKGNIKFRYQFKYL